MARSSRRMVAAVAALVTFAAGLAGVSVGSTPPAAAAGNAVTYTPETVMVPYALAHQQLLRVSADGATYTFKKRVGALAKLKTGSVMLLEQIATRNVTSAKIVKKHWVVKTTAAALTDVVSDGTLTWDTGLDWANAFALGGSGVPIWRPSARGGGGFTLKGEVEGYEWSATFTPSATGMAVKIAITRESPVELEVSITGTIGQLQTTGSISVARRQLTDARWLANNIAGKFELAYSAKPLSALGLGEAGGIKITLPAEVAVPFMVGPIPFYVGIKVAFIASAGFSQMNQELAGSYTLEYDGNGGFAVSSAGATTAQGVLSGLGKILLDAASAVANGPITFTLGAQLPQLELGMGTKGLSIAGTVTLVGQTGIVTYGAGCDARKFQTFATAGAKASFFGLGANLFSKTLFDKSYYASYPAGCGVFPG